MAELGNILAANSGPQQPKIEIDMLDFCFIKECKDWKLVNAIVDVLKSGKEGYYPDVSIYLSLLVVKLSFNYGMRVNNCDYLLVDFAV